MNERDKDIEMIRINASTRQVWSGGALGRHQTHVRKCPVGFGCALSSVSMSQTGHHVDAMLFLSGIRVAETNQGGLAGNDKPDTKPAALDPGG